MEKILKLSAGYPYTNYNHISIKGILDNNQYLQQLTSKAKLTVS